PSDLVRRLDGQSRAQGASRSGVAERWLRAGERQASLFSLEQELERYYAQPIEPEETGLSAVLGKAARETAAEGDRGRRPRGRAAARASPTRRSCRASRRPPSRRSRAPRGARARRAGSRAGAEARRRTRARRSRASRNALRAPRNRPRPRASRRGRALPRPT